MEKHPAEDRATTPETRIPEQDAAGARVTQRHTPTDPADRPQPSVPPPAPGPADGEPRFGAELRRLRTAAGWSQRDLAERTAYDRSHISKVENGKAPTADFARECDRVLGAAGALIALADREPPPCPYPGLACFEPGDARWFHGRRRAVTELLAQLEARATTRTGPLVVVGPSGAGKSSLLRAGLHPALGRGDLTGRGPGATVLFTPTAAPDEALDAARAEHRGTGGEVWIVDQLEEVFTLCSDPGKQRAFLDALCAEAGPGGPRLVVAGVRADFYGGLLAHDGMLAAVRAGQLALGPMSGAELRAAITAPAGAAGLDLQPGLVELLLHDLGLRGAPSDGPDGEDTGGGGRYDPGTLPLLAHTLRAVWQQREGRTLTLDGYRATGGLHGSVAATAERAWQHLDPGRQRAARQILLRLVHVGEGTGPTRRRTPRRHLEAVSDSPVAAELIDLLARHRLITVRAATLVEDDEPAGREDPDAPTPSAGREDPAEPAAADRPKTPSASSPSDGTVTLAHEALLHAWPRLARWISADRAGLRTHQRLAEAVAAWQEAGRDDAALLTGPRLDLTLAWAAEDGERFGLSRAEHQFLAASDRAQRDRLRADARRTRLLRRLTAGQALAVVLLLVAALLAFVQFRGAQRQARTATAGVLAALAASTAEGRPDTAAWLAAQSSRLAPGDPRAAGALAATTGGRFAGRLPLPSGQDASGLAFAPGRRLLAVDGPATPVTLVDPVTRRIVKVVTDGPAAGLVFTRDGTLLAAVRNGAIQVWDVRRPRTPHLVRILRYAPSTPNGLAFSPNGRELAAAYHDGVGRIWDVRTGALRARLARPGRGPAAEMLGIAYAPVGSAIATCGRDRTAVLWTPAPPGSPHGAWTARTVARHRDTVISVAFSPDGSRLATTSDDSTAAVQDAATGRHRVLLTGHQRPVFGVAFAPVGSLVATSSYDQTVRLWDGRDGTQVERLHGHTGNVYGVAFSDDGRYLATAGAGGADLWDMGGPRVLTPRPFTAVHAVAADPAHHLLATGGDDSVVRLWDDRTGRERRDIPLDTAVGGIRHLAFGPDPRLIGVTADTSDAYLLDLRRPGPARRIVLRGHTEQVRDLAFTGPSGPLVTVANDGTTRLWDPSTGHPTGELPERQHHDDGLSLAVAATTADGVRLVARPGREAVRLWVLDPSAGPVFAGSIPAGPSMVQALAFGPDGRELAAARDDQTVSRWSLRLVHDGGRWRVTARARPALTGATGPLHDVAFGPGGRWVAAVGVDMLVHVWDASTGAARATPAGHDGILDAVAFANPDTVVSAGDDGTVRQWSLSPAAGLAHACAIARPLTRAQWTQAAPHTPYPATCR